MKQITASKYEELALDYLEGKLSGADRAAFERYLKQDIQAASDIEALRHFMPAAAAQPVVYPGMEALLRGPKLNLRRRVLSLMGGAAASAAIVACLMLAGKDIGLQDRVAETPSVPALPEQAAVEMPVVAEPQPVLTVRVAPANEPNVQAGADVRSTRADTVAKAAETVQSSVQIETISAIETPQPVLAKSTPEETSPAFTLPPDALEPILADFTPERREKNLGYSELDPETSVYETGESMPRTQIGFLLGRTGLIKPYETEEGRGIEIASLIRIGRRNTEREKIND